MEAPPAGSASSTDPPASGLLRKGSAFFGLDAASKDLLLRVNDARNTILNHRVFSGIMAAKPLTINQSTDTGYKAPYSRQDFELAVAQHGMHEAANNLWVLDVLRSSAVHKPNAFKSHTQPLPTPKRNSAPPSGPDAHLSLTGCTCRRMTTS